MGSRDVWKHGSGRQLNDLLSSALLTLLLPVPDTRPVYFSSPWMSDFALFDNSCRNVAVLFPGLAERSDIRFVDFLLALASLRNVRLITSRNRTSTAFIGRLKDFRKSHAASGLQVRFSAEESHEKGILSPGFYVDGSMNITHSGVHVRGEKITYHPAIGDGAARVASAYFEFNRRWSSLAAEEYEW